MPIIQRALFELKSDNSVLPKIQRDLLESKIPRSNDSDNSTLPIFQRDLFKIKPDNSTLPIIQRDLF